MFNYLRCEKYFSAQQTDSDKTYNSHPNQFFHIDGNYPVKSFILTSLLFFFILLSSLSSPSFAADKGNSPDRYLSDRFIFLGWLYNKPLITTIQFSRGFSGGGKFRNVAEFQGYLLFMDKWHNMKNGNYLETDSPVDIENIPEFKPCIMSWKDKQESGAANYEYQELSLLLQFRNLKLVDTMGKEPDFLINTYVGQGVLQFQGQQVPGVMIYQHSDLTGYNRLAHNFAHFNYRKLENFFLLGQDGDIFIIRAEQEGNKISDQWVPDTRVIHVGTTGEIALLEGPAAVKWLKTEKENDPDSKFRIYPVEWELTLGTPPEKTQLTATSGFYWFSYGLSGITGIKGGRLFMGLAEIIRGE